MSKQESDRINRQILLGIILSILVVLGGIYSVPISNTGLIHNNTKVQAYMHPEKVVKGQFHKHQVKHQVNQQARHKYHKVYARHYYRHHYRKYINGHYVDCWVMSSRIYSQLVSNGQRARIIQYATSQSPRHRSVQVYKNGAWVNYDYSGYAETYHATSNSINGKVIT